MNLEHLLVIILGNAAFIVPLFLWNRSESRADIHHMDQKLEANRLEANASRIETNALIKSIQEEIKDFHNRLLQIEASK